MYKKNAYPIVIANCDSTSFSHQMLKNNFYNDSKGRSYFTPRLLLKFVCIISFFRFNQYMVLKMKKKSYLARHIFFLKFRIEIKKKPNKQTCILNI